MDVRLEPRRQMLMLREQGTPHVEIALFDDQSFSPCRIVPLREQNVA
jgi:hypothetical protein